MEAQRSMEHYEAIRTQAAHRYLHNEMTGDERDTFEVHCAQCAACAGAVSSGVLPLAEARSESRPSVPLWSVVSLAAAASLALVVGYQTFITIPGLRGRLETPQALAPVALVPVSGGEGPEVALPARGAPLALALDVKVDAGPLQLVYDLRTDAGVVLLSGQAPIPPPGTPLLLLLPGSSLTAGVYVVVVRSGDSPAREVGTYRFVAR